MTMYFHSETALLNACRTLFGQEVSLTQDFLDYLQPSGAKTAFRTQAKAHHPDLHAASSPLIRRQQTERFREIRQAYDLLIDFLERRPTVRRSPVSKSPPRPSSYWDSRPVRRRPRPSRPQTRPAAIPAIPLEFGMFAFYRGKITYQQLIEALVWQRRQRPALGTIAQKWGWLSDVKVARILGYRGHAARFGKKAVELGYLRPHQVDALLKHQQKLQRRIGRYFVDKGLLTEAEADRLADQLLKHNSQVQRRVRRGANVRF